MTKCGFSFCAGRGGGCIIRSLDPISIGLIGLEKRWRIPTIAQNCISTLRNSCPQSVRSSRAASATFLT